MGSFRGSNDLKPFWILHQPGAHDLLRLTFQGALGEINLFSAPLADMLFVKLIRKDLSFLPAVGTFADERLQMLELLKTGAVLWCDHKKPPEPILKDLIPNVTARGAGETTERRFPAISNIPTQTIPIQAELSLLVQLKFQPVHHLLDVF